MNKFVEIGSIPLNAWDDYRDLWLEALKETPEAFAADYTEQSTTPENIWRQRLRSVVEEKDALMVFAKIGPKLVGMIGAYFDTNPKFRHIATIWGAYVKPEYRKQGVATDMANALLLKLKDRSEIKKVKTYAITNAHLAVNVYKNFGFDIIGISKEELRVDDKYYDVYIMEKILR